MSVEFVGDARVDGGDRVDRGVGEGREVVHLEIDHCCGIAFPSAIKGIMRSYGVLMVRGCSYPMLGAKLNDDDPEG